MKENIDLLIVVSVSAVIASWIIYELAFSAPKSAPEEKKKKKAKKESSPKKKK